ncbi:Gfo/Idh/MocA family oxidoreductase [Cohnella pontilimi]|uniref:Gfo/Idh/MocA family oxidoreductase n=1 Tax=Cohnella pontilimi TaxID=2564100 RepID=A0A4U0FGT5_9BACL|nr:Gfo/Idh/MocA family oxidoreductase [Cohnella pontilimi]TJY44118.1 Gfo/Idh/MocA family oxidoreductase [Cohnella pontilimi]
MAKQINVAIIGQGRSGRDIHADALIRLPELYKIVAVSDQLEERRIKAERELGCAAVADYAELFERDDVDLIVNSTPSNLHVPVSLECLERGFHVLCEKPLARRAAEVDRLMEASSAAGKTLAVFQQSRYSPAFVKIREIISSGQIGRVVQASFTTSGFSRRWDWQTLQDKNGGNLLNNGSHPLDQALQLFGTDAMPNVFCRMDRANSFGDAEDYVKVFLHGEGRPVIDLEISSCDAFPKPAFLVQGTRGGISGSVSRLQWKYFLPEEAPEQQLVVEPLSRADGTPAYCREELVWHEQSWEASGEEAQQMYPYMAACYYRMLHLSLTEGTPLEITVPEVRQQIAVIEECFRQNPEFTRRQNF